MSDTTEADLDKLTDDTEVYVVSSRWGTTIHRALLVTRGRGADRRTIPVQDHPSCQAGDVRVGPLGGYHAAYVGPLAKAPINLFGDKRGRPRFRLCNKCFDIPRAQRTPKYRPTSYPNHD